MAGPSQAGDADGSGGTAAGRPLEGQIALVTGGGVRLGRAIAERLGRAGASVALHYNRSKAEAEAAAGRIAEGGSRTAVLQADLTDPGAALPLMAACEAWLGPPTILVNSAALFERSAFVETGLDSMDRQWALNARAPFLLTQAFARSVLRRVEAGGSGAGVGESVGGLDDGRHDRGGAKGQRGAAFGAVVNVLDIGGALVPWKGYAAYGMTKAALASLTRTLALELAPHIRVNAVAPGVALPPEDMPAEAVAKLIGAVPQGRVGSAEEVAETVLFLVAGPAYITGEIIAVDGGQRLTRAAPL